MFSFTTESDKNKPQPTIATDHGNLIGSYQLQESILYHRTIIVRAF